MVLAIEQATCNQLLISYPDIITHTHTHTHKPGEGGVNIKAILWGFPGGSVVKKPPVNAGNMNLIPGPRRSHMDGATKPVCRNC